jgi:hypothetical protein
MSMTDAGPKGPAAMPFEQSQRRAGDDDPLRNCWRPSPA